MVRGDFGQDSIRKSGDEVPQGGVGGPGQSVAGCASGNAFEEAVLHVTVFKFTQQTCVPLSRFNQAVDVRAASIQMLKSKMHDRPTLGISVEADFN